MCSWCYWSAEHCFTLAVCTFTPVEYAARHDLITALLGDNAARLCNIQWTAVYFIRILANVLATPCGVFSGTNYWCHQIRKCTSSVWIWRKSVQRLPKHKQMKSQTNGTKNRNFRSSLRAVMKKKPFSWMQLQQHWYKIYYTQWTIKNVAVYFWLQLWLILTDFYSFYIILIVKKFYMQL